MSLTSIKAFDSTIHTTNIWLNDVMEKLGWEDKQKAYHALRVVLHALRDRLPVDQAVALGAQLPMLVRGFYFDGWHPADKPVKERKKEAFLSHVILEFPEEPDLNAETVTRGVFSVISKHVTPGIVQHVKNVLPAGIRQMWEEEPETVWF